MDEVIIEELREDIELFDEEFEHLVHCWAEDTDAVSLYGIEHLGDCYCFDLFSLFCALDKDLSVQVVMILWDESL